MGQSQIVTLWVGIRSGHDGGKTRRNISSKIECVQKISIPPS